MFVAHLGFFLTYGAPDKDLMMLPTYVVWSLWVGVGASELNARWSARAATASSPVMAIVLGAIAIGSIGVNYRYVDLSSDWSARESGETIFTALPSDALYMGAWADIPILEYLQLVERERPDVRLVNLVFTSGDEATRLTAAHIAAGRRAYTSVPGCLSGDGFRYDTWHTGDLFEIRMAKISRDMHDVDVR
jgi:hypothetical protein